MGISPPEESDEKDESDGKEESDEKPGQIGTGSRAAFRAGGMEQWKGVKAAGGPEESASGPYRVLAPIESGNLLLFPVVRADEKSTTETPFITLDEGLKSGEVEVTEAGRARGLVRREGRRGTAELRSRRRSEHAGPGQSLQAAAAAAGGRGGHGRQAGPHRRQRPHCSSRRRPHRSLGFLHRAWPLDGKLGRPSARRTSRPPTASWSSPRCASAPWSSRISSRCGTRCMARLSQMEVAAAPPTAHLASGGL